MTIALFFGSTTGNTEDIADQIRDILGSDKVDIYNVADAVSYTHLTLPTKRIV